ncbi:hypothetical protein ACF068_08200 [Streptomyces sp. NPDC016309]
MQQQQRLPPSPIRSYSSDTLPDPREDSTGKDTCAAMLLLPVPDPAPLM